MKLCALALPCSILLTSVSEVEGPAQPPMWLVLRGPTQKAPDVLEAVANLPPVRSTCSIPQVPMLKAHRPLVGRKYC